MTSEDQTQAQDNGDDNEGTSVEASEKTPRPGQRGFDYKAAFSVERDHRLEMLAKQRDLHEELDALWESVIKFNAHPMRELVGRSKAAEQGMRKERDQQMKVNRALIELLREHDIEIPAEAQMASLGDMLARRDRQLTKIEQGNKTLRRSAREARIVLEKAVEPGRLVQQVARLDTTHSVEKVLEDVLAPVEKAIRILAAGEVVAAGGKQAPHRALLHATDADVKRAKALADEDDADDPSGQRD